MVCVRTTKRRCLALLALAGLVHGTIETTAVPGNAHAASPPKAAQQAPRAKAGGGQQAAAGTLPPAVNDMRDAILDAVKSGLLDDLKIALDLNELKPELAAAPVPDPLAFWRKISADGEGRDILATLGILFELPYAVQPLGKDPENTRVFVWPAFADRPLATLTADEDAHLLRLEPAAKAAAMKTQGRYTGWRLVIGADGVWHVFRRYD